MKRIAADCGARTVRPAPRLPGLVLSLAASCVLGGCKSDSGGSFDAENASYGERTATTTNTYTLTRGGTMGVVSPVRSSEQKSLSGQTYDRVLFSVPGNATALEGWYTTPSADTLVLAGGARGSNKTVVFDTPVSIPLSPPVGRAQPIRASATVTNPSVPSGARLEAAGTYTLVESGVSVTTSTGKIEGASHFQASGTVSGNGVPASMAGKSLTADVYYHPSYGVVAASIPEVGWQVGMSESSDCGKVDSSGHRVIRKTAVVTPSAPFKLDSYECAGNQFDADKNTHAAMLLELRWADETQAKSTNKPGYPLIDVEFGTVFGVFPSELVQASKSVFHPEENDKGYVFWYAYVNQAAKNESGSNGIAYHISVTEDPGFSPVRATARIYYKTYP